MPLLFLLLALAPGKAPEAAQRAVSALSLLAVDDEVETASPAELRAEHEERLAMAREALSAIEEGRLPYAEAAREVVAAAQSADPFAAASRLAAGLRFRMVRELGLSLAPRRPPDLRRGERLYAQSCAACHGPSGRPPAGNPLQLSTPPPVLADREATRGLSPLRIFDAITAGVPQTAMPSFAQALDVQQRWDLAFWLRAVAHEGPRAARAPELTLREAAVSSDELLSARLEAGGLRPDGIEAALARIRWSPPSRPGSRERLPLVVPRFLAAARLVSDEVADDGSLSASVVLLEPAGADRQRILSLAKLVARQMFLRAERPPPQLDLKVYESAADLRAGRPAIAACSLASWAYYRCGVAPAPDASAPDALAANPRR